MKALVGEVERRKDCIFISGKDKRWRNKKGCPKISGDLSLEKEAEGFWSTTKIADGVTPEAMEIYHDIISGRNEGLREQTIATGAVDSEDIKEKNTEWDGDRRTMIPKTGVRAQTIEILPKEHDSVGSRLSRQKNRDMEVKGKKDKEFWTKLQSLRKQVEKW